MATITNEEQWRPILGYEGIYEVSDMGRVRSLDRRDRRGYRQKGKPKTLTLDANGYPVVNLWSGTGRTHHVHRLVAGAFLGESGGLSVNHKSGDKQDNRPGNLEYLTLAENTLHQHGSGWTVQPLGSANGKSKLSESDIPDIRRLRREGKTYRQIGEAYHVSDGAIRAVTTGRTWSHVEG